MAKHETGMGEDRDITTKVSFFNCIVIAEVENIKYI